MKCPCCTDKDLIPVMTKQGVEVDFCPQCEGIWLDKNEIYLFTKRPSYLWQALEEALKSQKPSSRLSPATGKPMVELPLLKGKIIVDYCPESEGFWLDKGEINKLPEVKSKIEIDRGSFEKEPTILPKTLLPLPNLAFRSGMTIFGLYAMVTLVLILAVEFTGLTPTMALITGVAIALAQFLFGPFVLDFILNLLFTISWVEPEKLPAHLRSFIDSTCEKKNIKFPMMGLIHDGAPNAFTYGHHPNNARIVITQGLLDLLDEKESEAVVAHEIGHVVHWDMLVMTLANLVPLILYYIYRTLSEIKGNDKTETPKQAISITAYLLYIVSEYIVLWFSRTREFYADRFAGEVTGNPNSLASALVKIGYGLAGDESGKRREKDDKDKKRKNSLGAIGAMGIFDTKTANILAISGYAGPQKMGGEVNKKKLRDAAKWDLWNPWAKYYELHSTHPLIASRIKYLSNQSSALGKEPYVRFNESRPESYWDEFLVDMGIKFLPVIAICLALTVISMHKETSFIVLDMAISFVGLAYLIELLFSYPNADFAPMNIHGLLKKIKVSAVRPVPCKIKGTIIGRGVPGLIYSEDFVLQDKTGIIFLDYRQPLRIIEFFFGALRAAKYINKEAEITGWYRRAPIPYIEIKKLETDGEISTCFVYHMKLLFASIAILAGLYVAFVF